MFERTSWHQLMGTMTKPVGEHGKINLVLPYITVSSLLHMFLWDKNCEKEKKSIFKHGEKMCIAKVIVFPLPSNII